MTTITPRPGRLPVTFDNGLGDVTKPLIQVPDGEWVDADCTVTALRLHGGRATLTLTAADSTMSAAQVDADTMRKLAHLLVVGGPVTVRGVVRRLPGGMPLIDVRAARAL